MLTEPTTGAAEERRIRELGRAAFDGGHFAEAAELFGDAAACSPRRPWAWLWLARARQRLGDIPGSYEAVETALSCQPDLVHALWHLVDLHLVCGQEAKVPETVARIRALLPDDLDTARRAALRLLRAGAPAEGLDAAEAALAIEPCDQESLVVKGTVLHRLGREGDLDAFVRTALSGGSASVRVARIRVELATGRCREAWESVQASPAASASVKLTRAVAHALRRDGHLRDARLAYVLAERCPGQHPDVRLWHERLQGEIQVLSAAWRPPVRRRGALSPVPGRVLHLVGKSAPHSQSGYTIRTQSLAVSQRRAGLDPHVVTQLGFPWTERVRECAVQETHEGIPHHRLLPPDGALPERLDASLDANADRLAGLVRRLRPAVLHAASDYRNAILAQAVGRAFDLPVVYEVRGFWEETWLSKQQREAGDSDGYVWRRERELQMAGEADHVVTLSDGMKRELSERGVEPARITVVPNAVDAESFVPVPRSSRLAGRWGIAEHEVVIGYISSFSRYEGICHLIDAIAELVRAGLPVRGLLVGDGDEREALQRQVSALGMADRITLTGRVPHADVLSYYGLIDVFVVPRTADRVCQLVTPLKPYEAMATGRALVVSGTDALREMVHDGLTGLVFRPEDADDLAGVLQPLVLDPGARRRLGRQAREWVCANRTWTHNGQRYRELYETLGVA